MRKSDIEYIEMLLSPLRATLDRHDGAINSLDRQGTDFLSRLSELERDRDANSLAVEQAVTSVRSLLQRANRKMRESGDLVDEDEPPPDSPLAESGLEVHHVRRHGGRLIL